MLGYDLFYKKLIASVSLKNVTSRFAMEKIKSTTAPPIPFKRKDSFKKPAPDTLILIRQSAAV